MFHSIVLYVLLTVVVAYSVYGSYRYIGCYQEAFYDSYFESSYMEPALCFRLCETPIIYIQHSICRCSWSGLMDYSRQRDIHCSTFCPKSGYRHVSTNKSCGGTETYSAYAENQFYTKHAHLFDYRIRYRSCEFWNSSGYYDTLQVKIDESSGKLALNKLERCAAACLDQNKTAQSIAFNRDNNQCTCIIQQKLNVNSDHALNLTILSNNACDRYCDNKFGESNIGPKFKCGSENASRIWAVYDLADLCPIDFIYIKELKECMSSSSALWNLCPSSSKKYVYDGNITWSVFLSIIDQLNLTKKAVSINFVDDIIIDPAWKCLPKYSKNDDRKYYGHRFRTSYSLDNGCLREDSWHFSLESSTGLCITYPISDISLSNDISLDFTHAFSRSQMLSDCPMDWVDLNKHCYQISDTSETIHEGRNSCITLFQTGLSETHEDFIESISYHDYNYEADDDLPKERNNKSKVYISDLHKGELVQYSSQWQGRLGFFLLDTNISSTASTNENNKDILSVRSNINATRSSTNEFQMINVDNSTGKNDSCLVFTRLMIDDTESSILKSTPIDNCSKPRPILCTIQPIMHHSALKGCFQKPLTLGLPAIISNHSTYKFCLYICQELKTKLAVLQMNRCYCLNAGITWLSETKRNNSMYRKVDCGNPCSGNKHEQCGDENTIVVYNVTDSLSSYIFSYITQPDRPTPDFSYDSCIYLYSVNLSTTYQFIFKRRHDIQPRHCLEICTEYHQNYALLNQNKCLCTNNPPKRHKSSDSFPSQDFSCTQECPGNYFYTCGNASNSSLYSMYVMELHCPTGFSLDRDKKRCVYLYTSTKSYVFLDAQSHCKSIGGMLAKVNDILEIQDVLFSSLFSLTSVYTYLLHSHDFSSSPYDNKKYFWIDRVPNFISTSKISNRTIRRCTQTTDSIDPHCVVLRFERILIQKSISYEPCLTESDECRSESAVSVCVDKHLEPDSAVIPPIRDGSSSTISVNTLVDYTCGKDKEYLLVDGYCYKVDFHETTWKEAKAKCEGNNATLFIPEKTTTIRMIRELFLRQRVYATSGFAHVGLVYNNQKRTVIQYNTKNGSVVGNLSASDFPYDKCKETFLTVRLYRPLMPSRLPSNADKEGFKSRKTGCGYVDFRSNINPSISCSEVTCKLLATVICQKLPSRKMETILVKRSYIGESIDDNQESNRSIRRDYTPMFFILGLAFVFILLALVNILYKRYQIRERNNRSHREGQNHNTIYSPITSAHDFELN